MVRGQLQTVLFIFFLQKLVKNQLRKIKIDQKYFDKFISKS